MRDLSTERNIVWQAPQSAYTDTYVYYRPKGTNQWTKETGSNVVMYATDLLSETGHGVFSARATPRAPGSVYPVPVRLVHRVKLRNLTPGVEYEFVYPNTAKKHTFRTLPATINPGDDPVKFCVAGDSYHLYPEMLAACERMQALDVDFWIHGGDWSYADANPDELWCWDDLWQYAFTPNLVNPRGHTVPIIPVIGNHEGVGGSQFGRHDDEWFFQFFDFPAGRSGAWEEWRAGDYLSVAVIDTEMATGSLSSTHPHVQWLDQTLQDNASIKHRIAAQHVAIYPSNRSFGGSRKRGTRQHIRPLYEQHNLRTVFEHHDHVYKVTHYMAGGDATTPGTVVNEGDALWDDRVKYFGDGTHGVNIRSANNKSASYIEDSQGWGDNMDQARAFFYVELYHDRREIYSVDVNGNFFNQHTEPADA